MCLLNRSATHSLAWARRSTWASAGIGDTCWFAVCIQRFAILILARHLQFLFLHFGAPLWFAVCFRRFAVSHYVRLFSACLQRWGSVKFGAGRRLWRFAVLVRHTPLWTWVTLAQFWPFFLPFMVLLHWFCIFCISRTLVHQFTCKATFLHQIGHN